MFAKCKELAINLPEKFPYHLLSTGLWLKDGTPTLLFLWRKEAWTPITATALSKEISSHILTLFHFLYPPVPYWGKRRVFVIFLIHKLILEFLGYL